jgi:hypothetical protein
MDSLHRLNAALLVLNGRLSSYAIAILVQSNLPVATVHLLCVQKYYASS